MQKINIVFFYFLLLSCSSYAILNNELKTAIAHSNTAEFQKLIKETNITQEEKDAYLALSEDIIKKWHINFEHGTTYGWYTKKGILRDLGGVLCLAQAIKNLRYSYFCFFDTELDEDFDVHILSTFNFLLSMELCFLSQLLFKNSALLAKDYKEICLKNLNAALLIKMDIYQKEVKAF